MATRFLNRGVRRYAAPRPLKVNIEFHPTALARAEGREAESKSQVMSRLRAMFPGKNLEQIIAATGAKPGSTLRFRELTHVPKGETQPRPSLAYMVEHPHYETTGHFYRDDRGNVAHYLSEHALTKPQENNPLKGRGVELWGERDKALEAAGVKYTRLHAAGGVRNAPYNGNTFWPKAGFNWKLDPNDYVRLPQHLKDHLLDKPKDIHSLISHPEGHKEWAKLQSESTDAYFDHSEGSPHREVLGRELNARATRRSQSPDQVQAGGASQPQGTVLPRDGSSGGTDEQNELPDGSPSSGVPRLEPTTGSVPRDAATPRPGTRSSAGVTKPTKPNTPMSRRSDVPPIHYGPRKDTTVYDPIVHHAAAAIANPEDDTALRSLGDHLMEHPQHEHDPAVHAFAGWINNPEDMKGWHALAPHIHPVSNPALKGWEGRGTTYPAAEPEVQARNPRARKVSQTLMGFAQRAENLGRMREHIPHDPTAGYVRDYANNYWQQARYNERFNRRGGAQRGQRGWIPFGPRLSHAQVAHRVLANTGVNGLIQFLIAHRHFHPAVAARPDQEAIKGSGAKFSRKSVPTYTTGPKRYAKVDGDVPAHRLVAGFPIEYALRHLANDPANHDSIRHLAKSALTGKDFEGNELHNPASALWGLNDALQENDHPAKGWYNWMNAADKLHEDATMHRALEKVANEDKAADLHGHVNAGYHTPETIAIRAHAASFGRGNQPLMDRVLNHYKAMLPTKRFEGVEDMKRAKESILRHAGRADALALARIHPDLAKQQAKYALGAAGQREGHANPDIEKATRYAKGAKKYGMMETFKGYHFPEEQQYLDKPATREAYLGHVETALNNKPGAIPTLNETKALATHGEPARGGYRTATNLITGLLGNPMDAHRFAEATAIMSPSTGWIQHTKGALESLAHWHEAGRPSDEAALTKIFGTSVKSPTGGWMKDPATPSLINFNGYMGIKPTYMKKLFSVPDELYQGARSGWNRMTSGEGLKVPNFGIAHVDPMGKPIDTHMAKLFVPEHLHAVMHDAGFDLGAPENRKMAGDILEAQKKMASDPATILAYGTLLHHTAKEMGWEPREVQEAVWVATLAAMAAKSRGTQDARDILGTFSQHSLRQGWDMRPVLTDPGLIRLLHRTYGVKEGDVYDALADAERKRPLEAGGKARTSHFPAYATAVARLPARSQPGAAGIVQAHTAGQPVRKKERDRKAGQVKKYMLNPNDNFLDALRAISASNNLAPVATALAKKMGARGVAVPALHNSRRGSVPGVAMAIYGRQDPSKVHYLAGQIALANERKNKASLPPGVSVFHVRPGGKDTIFKFYQEGSGLDILTKLDRHGIDNRVLSPHHKGFNVFVPVKSGENADAVRNYARTHNVTVQSSQGYFTNVGSPDPSQAREQFRNKVVDGAAPQPPRPATGE